MWTVRRVVTGHRTDGKSIIVSDKELSGIEMPGLGTSAVTLWGSDQTLTYPDDGSEPLHHSFFPPIGGFRFVELVLPPDRPPPADVDWNHMAAELERLFPGLIATMLPESAGMHRSATVDVLYIVSGRCVLELDDGSKTHLKAGDVLVESGTMHRWHNPGDEPCRAVGMMVGTRWK
jgi:mannose-6-phosphate isomerase-like protein (cupin superfamily)